jgi:hypothetical protein
MNSMQERTTTAAGFVSKLDEALSISAMAGSRFAHHPRRPTFS